MRLPSGYGSVVKMSGKRRNPYIVRKTAGWHYDAEKDKQVQDYIIIGYAKTKAEGLKMLAEYNANPYDIKASKMTFSEIYEEWKKDKFPTVSNSSINSYVASYKSCTILYDRVFSALKLADLQKVIDTCDKNYPTLRKIKILFNQLYDFALKNDICNKDYSVYVDVAKFKDRNPNRYNRRRISIADLDKIWTMSNDSYWQIVLMLVYNGCRIGEFLDLKKEDVNLEEHYFNITRSKTENGLRRVPIADKTYDFYVQWFNKFPDSEYLIATPEGKHFLYRNYYDSYFTPLMEQLDMTYTPHCTRHTTGSMLGDAGVEPTVVKKILGHSGAMSLTERVYTHLDIKVLLDAINKI